MVTPVSSVTASTPERMERRRGGRWTALTVVELVLAAGAVITDLFLPALVLVALAGVSLLVRRSRSARSGSTG